MGRACSQNERSAFKILTVKPTRNRPLGKPRLRWENNVKIDFKGICVNTRNRVAR